MRYQIQMYLPNANKWLAIAEAVSETPARAIHKALEKVYNTQLRIIDTEETQNKCPVCGETGLIPNRDPKCHGCGWNG